MMFLLRLNIIVLIVSLCFSCASKAPDSKANVRGLELPDKPDEGIRLKDLIHERLEKRNGEFDACFETEIKKDKSFPARKIMSLFSLTKEGKVKEAGIVTVHPVTREFKDCFSNIISSISFEPVPEKETLLIFYPIKYR